MTRMKYATVLDPNLEQWRIIVAEWVGSLKRGKNVGMSAARIFLIDYIHGQKLETNPVEFLRAEYVAPCLYESCLKKYSVREEIIRLHIKITEIVGFALSNYLSIEDDLGIRIIPPEFKNPIPVLPEAIEGHRSYLQESDKSVLPYRYITKLRHLLCPKNSVTFSDWKWAQKTTPGFQTCGGWFKVPFELIDQSDPDCVWRKQNKTEYEMWSPVSAMLFYVKLQLPLRTYQVRMLDSGEADTYRYFNGAWKKNSSLLAQGTKKNPLRHGVFREITDEIKRVSMTGLYINTNKTADHGKDKVSKGYTLPWEHSEVLYWLQKLRDWQEKYNPITAATSWTRLGKRHFGALKSAASLREMGSSCFLFRDAAAQGDDRSKPLAVNSNRYWRNLLQELEDQCLVEDLRDAAGSPLVFVKKEL